MSDDDFMQDSDAEEYDFEYEDGDDDDEGDVGVENKYYNAKQQKLSDPDDALAEFLSIPELEGEKGEWGFKGLKQAIKLELSLQKFDDAVKHYEELLTYVKSAVTRNYSEKSINNMLDCIEKSVPDGTAYLERFYSLTLDCFQATNNERLWLKTNIKLTKLLLDREDYGQATRKLRELHAACRRPDGSDDPSKGTYSLEIYALEIQMHSQTKNNNQLKKLYRRALSVRSAVPHPRVMGIIRECGGKMHMSGGNWADAQSDFSEAFRNYDEAGSLQRIQVLKYLLLTTMLTKSEINPFDSHETKPYRNDPRIAAMTELVEAYQQNDVFRYDAVLAANRDLLADPFIAENIDEVTRDMRTQALAKLVAPYTRVRLAWVADKLQISTAEAMDIAAFLVTDGRLSATIDEHEGVLHLDGGNGDDARTEATRAAAGAVCDLYRVLFADGDGFRWADSAGGLNMLGGPPTLARGQSGAAGGSGLARRARGDDGLAGVGGTTTTTTASAGGPDGGGDGGV